MSDHEYQDRKARSFGFGNAMPLSDKARLPVSAPASLRVTRIVGSAILAAPLLLLVLFALLFSHR